MNEGTELNGPIAVLIKTDHGRGSGFFIEENLIVTNIHVVAKGTSVSAELARANAVYTVEGVAAFDAKNDLVILKTVNKGTPLPIGDSDAARRGDIVQVVGYPRGKYKITEGPVHSIRDGDKWIRMKFKTGKGNSGGPVLGRNSEVVGIAVADADYFSFAIPVKVIKMLLVQREKTESLIQWQGREQIRAYAYFCESQNKHSPNLYREAIDDLDKAIKLNPNCVYFYHSRGIVKSQLGKLKTDEGDLAGAKQFYRGTIDDCIEAIKLCPGYASVYNNRGAARHNLGQSKLDEGNVAEAQQHYRDAVSDYTAAIKSCPDFAIAYNNRAESKCFLGKSDVGMGNIEAAENLYQEALIDINTAIKLDSSYAVFHHTKGQIKAALGNYTAAIEEYERAIEIDPNYTDVCKDLELAKQTLEQQGKVRSKD